MPPRPEGRDMAKKAVMEYLKSLYEKQVQGIPLDNVDKRRIRKKCNLVQAVYDLNKGRIIETGTGEPKAGETEISRATINKAIDQLEKEDKIIERKFGEYRYRATDSELYDAFPILKVASDITIEPLHINSLAFYRTGAQYSSLIADYLNAQFSNDDIYSVPLGDIIMCMDMIVPAESTSVAKRFHVEDRIEDTLRMFSFRSIDRFDDTLGISGEELDEEYTKTIIRSASQEAQQAARYGGTINNKQPRKISSERKRKKTSL